MPTGKGNTLSHLACTGHVLPVAVTRQHSFHSCTNRRPREEGSPAAGCSHPWLLPPCSACAATRTLLEQDAIPFEVAWVALSNRSPWHSLSTSSPHLVYRWQLTADNVLKINTSLQSVKIDGQQQSIIYYPVPHVPVTQPVY